MALRAVVYHHAASIWLAEPEKKITQIASITGHTLATCHTILERYTVRTRKMAISAFQQRLEAEKSERQE